MLRLIRTILSIVSLLLALTTAVLWTRSWGKPLHVSMEKQTSIDKDREFHRVFEFHSLDAGYISVRYVRAIVDYSYDRAELERMRKANPGIMIHVTFDTWYLWPHFSSHANPPGKTTAGFSFDYGSHESSRKPSSALTGKWIRLSLPHWFLILLFSLPGILHAAHRFKQRFRLRRGLCPTCGYDLRESKSTCPECGALRSPAPPTP
ncbi:MAG TPA: hypothetical protein VGQ99_14165 [Tepidisphaeraceae bacterium]|jgi:hypothetical protein|nr:hypothetical protein [Tepidisphaeraceae bacterium]